jgi:enamine deaminase RidA (YjgF/YER057c/UK114 family)
MTYFPGGPLPARSAVGVTGLALGAQLEIECQAYAGNK